MLIVMAERDVLAASPVIDLDELAGRHFIFMAGDPALPVFRDLLAHVPTVCFSVEPLARETNLEPRRFSRRPFRLSHAAMAGSSSMA
ncbi:hypothetical protein FHS55_004653 [Angulomicrobium tetraedrale]|uniref:Uncharacterized protein n=1 Tax=Ancylobacter tetraedralis TaxID=217068 RepID=A0A839ZGM9_9HYPH|nr:hypothetical protein [Ancylobacter tetraedralis]